MWIIGDSHIARAKTIAKHRPGGYNINLDHLDVTVTFKGRGGAKIVDLPDLLLELVKMKGAYPEVVIIHLGSNDFEVDSQMGMHHRTKFAIDACRQMIPHTVVIFSLLLPRRFDNNFANQRKAAKVRRKVNSSIAKLAFSNGLRTISHPNINQNDSTIFTWDTVHLSDYGYGILLDTFSSAICHFFADHSSLCF